MSIGERILELRKERSVSQSELAEALGVSRQAVSKWENDLSSPDTLNLIRIAEVLESDVEYLTTGRLSYARRPPVVIRTTETVEKVIERPVVQVVEKTVERIVEKPVVEYVDKPVVKKVYRTVYVRKPLELILLGLVCFITGFILGHFLVL